MRRIIFRVSRGLVILGLSLLVATALLPVWVERERYLSLGTLGPYSFLAHRGGVLVSRRILVWHEVKTVPFATALLVVGGTGIVLARGKRIRKT
jgi:hypothetical protein